MLVLAVLTTPLVSAKPTSAANNPKSVSFNWHQENGASTMTEDGVKLNPPSAEIITLVPSLVVSPDTKVSHTMGSWTLNPDGDNYVQIGDSAHVPIDAETGYEGTLYVQSQYRTPTHMLMNYRVYEKIIWDGNYIEIMCLERANLEIILDQQGIPIGYNFYASGIFSGHGEIDGQKVQVTGIREGSFDILGNFILECYGTIRFAGKAP